MVMSKRRIVVGRYVASVLMMALRKPTAVQMTRLTTTTRAQLMMIAHVRRVMMVYKMVMKME